MQVRSFTGMGQITGNGLPEWTVICALEYFLCNLLGQSGHELPQKVISLRGMQFRYPKIRPHTEESEVIAKVTVIVSPLLLFIQLLINIKLR